MEETNSLLNSFSQWENYSRSNVALQKQNNNFDITNHDSVESHEDIGTENFPTNTVSSKKIEKNSSFKYNINPHNEIDDDKTKKNKDNKIFSFFSRKFGTNTDNTINSRRISLPMDFRTLNDDSVNFPTNLRSTSENKPKTYIPLQNDDHTRRPVSLDPAATNNLSRNDRENSSYVYNYRIVRHNSSGSSIRSNRQRPKSVPLNIYSTEENSKAGNPNRNTEKKQNRKTFNSWFICSSNKDFSSTNEFNKFKRKKKFIFHKGFIKSINNYGSTDDCNRSSSTRRKKNLTNFKNESEFTSYMNYINLSTINNNLSELNLENNNNDERNSMSYRENFESRPYKHRKHGNVIISSPNVAFFKPAKSQIVVNHLLPKQIYLQRTKQHNNENYMTFAQQYSLDETILNASNHDNDNNIVNQHKIVRKVSFRKNSIRRQNLDSSKNKNSHKTGNSGPTRVQSINSKKFVKRSNTLPNKFKFSDNELIEIWSKYLQRVIAQRIILRINLLISLPSKNKKTLQHSESSTLSTSLATNKPFPMERLN